jgi:hypothetical protein
LAARQLTGNARRFENHRRQQCAGSGINVACGCFVNLKS